MIPFPRTRKGLTILVAILLAVCIGISVFAFISWTGAQENLKEKGLADFNALSMDELEHNLPVQGTIDMAFDYYAETYETDFGIRTSDNSESLYYIVPIYDVDNNDNINIKYFITFNGDPKHFDTMEAIMTQTWTEVSSVSELNIESGIMRRLPDKFQGYLTEWSQSPDFYYGGSFIDWCVEDNLFGTNDRTIIQSKLVPYMIYESDSTSNLFVVWLFIGLSILMLVILLILKYSKAPIKWLQQRDNSDAFRQLRDIE